MCFQPAKIVQDNLFKEATSVTDGKFIGKLYYNMLAN